MRVWWAAIAPAMLASCGAADDAAPPPPKATPSAVSSEVPEADWSAQGNVPFAERKQHPMREGMGGWINRLEPQRNGECEFTERPAGSRPDGYALSAFSGNIDLWTRGDSLAHDHAIGFVEASFLSDDPVIAVRKDKPDLWIVPVGRTGNADVMLYIGADRFECMRIER